METYTLAELQHATQQERDALTCVKVEGCSRRDLERLAPDLGGVMCGSLRCTSVVFKGWKRTRCSACRRPPANTRERVAERNPAEQTRDSHHQIQDTSAVNQVRIETEQEMMIQGWTPPPGFGVYPSTWYGSFCRVWDGLKLMAGGHTPAPRPVHRANFPTAGE